MTLRDARAELFRRAFASLPVLGLVVDRSGAIIAANDRWEPVLGYRATDLEGRALVELVHPEDRSAVDAAIRRAIGEVRNFDEDAGLDARIRRMNGSFSWISWKFGVDAELVIGVGRVVDDERARADEDATRARLVEASGVAWLARDVSGRVTHWSRGAEVLYGYSEAEVLGRELGALLARRVAGRGTWAEVEAALARAGTWCGELAATTRDGRSLVVEHVLTETRDAAGHVSGVVEGHFDVTARVEAAARRTELVSTVSHELRTPLTGIRGALGLLDAGVVGELPAEARELVQGANTSAERLVRLVSGLLDLEKLDAGKLHLVPRELDAGALAERARTLMHGLAEARGVSVVVRAPEVLRVSADEERILQILTNLLSNAIKYSPVGAEVVISVGRGVRAERVRFSVRDRGPGIAPEHLGRLFQRFQQLERATGKPREGTGLGLAIAKALVEQHGGEIGVESAVGQGTELWFELPHVGVERVAEVRRASVRPRVLALAGDGAALRAAIDGERFELVVSADHARAEELLAPPAPRAVVVELGAVSRERIDAARVALATVPWIAIEAERGESMSAHVEHPYVDVLPRPIDARRLERALRRATSGEAAPRVLIVDDDAATRAFLAALLRPLAIECLLAEDGLDAIQRARELRPDLIILDVDLPRASGFDVVAVLKQEVFAATPLLVHSGRDLTAAERDALTLGVTRWCVKGQTTDHALVALVRELLLDVGDPFDAGPTNTFTVPPLT
ncbi:PAS domain S-box protein [Myxococcota bacterium]|nr:PAS domain S-box protein [Myxococcota bacterium]